MGERGKGVGAEVLLKALTVDALCVISDGLRWFILDRSFEPQHVSQSAEVKTPDRLGPVQWEILKERRYTNR